MRHLLVVTYFSDSFYTSIGIISPSVANVVRFFAHRIQTVQSRTCHTVFLCDVLLCPLSPINHGVVNKGWDRRVLPIYYSF